MLNHICQIKNTPSLTLPQNGGGNTQYAPLKEEQDQVQGTGSADNPCHRPPLELVSKRSQTALPSLKRASELSYRPARQTALPRLEAPAALTEILVDGARDGAATAFALALVASGREGDTKSAALTKAQASLTVWVQDPMSRLEAGVPYPRLGPYSKGEHLAASDLLLVKAAGAGDMLWAMEEALMSGAARAVIGDIWGQPKALNFTATKRLQRAAQIGKTPCLLLRYGSVEEGERPASGAYERWVLESQPSAGNPDNPDAPGQPAWRLDRFKSRLHGPAQWRAVYDGAALQHMPTMPHNDEDGVAQPKMYGVGG